MLKIITIITFSIHTIRTLIASERHNADISHTPPLPMHYMRGGGGGIAIYTGQLWYLGTIFVGYFYVVVKVASNFPRFFTSVVNRMLTPDCRNQLVSLGLLDLDQIFIGPLSDHCPLLSTTNQLTHVIETWLMCLWLLKILTQNFLIFLVDAQERVDDSLVENLKLKFGQDIKAEVWSRFWSKFLVETLRLRWD